MSSSLKLKNNVYWVGVKDPGLEVFDIIMNTKKGTTYNSYLIDDEKVAVIDTVKNGHYDEFLANIKSVIGDRKIDYIVVQHTELDHSGTLSKLINDYPEAQVVASRAALIYSRDILNREFNEVVASCQLNLGKTKLDFITAPNLHWPDTMFTYSPENEILFTCDFLGCHYCPDGNVLENIKEDYFQEMQYYYDVIMSPFKRFVIMALDKIKNINYSMVAPSHGPMHLNDIEKYMNLYKEWSTEKPNEEKNVQIFYISAYGNTELMANYIKDSLNKHGIKASAHEITSMNMEDIISLVESASGIMIGSPTINQDAVKPAWDVLSLVCAITNKGKAAGAFGSYGWSGEGVPMLTERLKALKFKVVDGGLRFKFVPSKEKFEAADEFISKFIELL